MYTECPHCQTLFRIRPEQLQAARGMVRCGRCGEAFDALQHLREPPAGAAAAAPVVRDADVAGAPARDEAAPTHAGNGDTAAPAPGTRPSARAPAAAAHPAPGTGTGPRRTAPNPPPEVPARLRRALAAAQARPRRRPAHTALGVLATLLLSLGLVAQVAYFRAPEVIAAAPELRPWLERFCAATGCDLSPPRDPERIALLNHDVRSHPEMQEALLIKATFVNQAGYAQPYPDIRITLSDLTDNIVAQRRFTPRDYLPAELQVSAHGGGVPSMAPDTPVYIDLEVLDPGKQAINYQFDFF